MKGPWKFVAKDASKPASVSQYSSIDHTSIINEHIDAFFCLQYLQEINKVATI